MIYQHHWSPPKGHLDQLSNGDWEDEMVAALRETEEEAGIDKHHLEVNPKGNACGGGHDHHVQILLKCVLL